MLMHIMFDCHYVLWQIIINDSFYIYDFYSTHVFVSELFTGCYETAMNLHNKQKVFKQ